MDARVSGLYAVTPDVDDTERLVDYVDAALDGGARLVQYRNKSATPALRVEQAARLAAVCARHRRPLVVNDHLELALSIDGAGLHVGADDVADADALRDLRRRLGPTRLLGVSCYRSLQRAQEAVAAGADHVAFGSVFASTTKPAALRAPLELFADARPLDVSTVGIGGITRDNLATLVAAGADAAAVVAELFAVADADTVRSRARDLAARFVDRVPPVIDSPYRLRTRP